MTKYYHLTSYGDDTNLQLYVMRQAKKYMDELRNDYEKLGQSTPDLHERCVFVVANAGLSLSQLLGQNDPVDQSQRVDSLVQIFHRFIDHFNLPRSLHADIDRFNQIYNGIRHFGRTVSGAGYTEADNLNYDQAVWCYDFAVTVWESVVNVFAADPENSITEFSIENLPTYRS